MPDALLLSYIYQLMMVRWLRYRCTAVVTTAATKENIALTSVHATHKTSEDNDDQRDSGPFRKWWFAVIIIAQNQHAIILHRENHRQGLLT